MAETRRRFLGQAALAVPAATLPAVALAQPSADPHVAWGHELREINDYHHSPAYYAVPDEEADDHPSWSRWDELQDLIGNTPAKTVAGVREQLWLIAYTHGLGCGLGANEGRALELAMGTLERMAGSEAHG